MKEYGEKICWKILFLVHAPNRKTKKYINALLEHLKQTKPSDEVAILVLYSTIPGKGVTARHSWITLFQIVEDRKKTGKKYGPVNEFGRADIGDDASLTNILRQINNQFPSEWTLLFTWDHGEGFGVFEVSPEENKRKPRTKLHIPSRNKIVYTSMLTNDELADVIRNSFWKEYKMDLVIMMNCWMQMIETGYALRDYVEILVASQTVNFWAGGYDVKRIIDQIIKNPWTLPEDVAKIALKTLKQFFTANKLKKEFKQLVISAVRPEKSLEVKNVIDLIADHLMNLPADKFGEIKKARKKCIDLSKKYIENADPFYYIDFVDYIDKIYSSGLIPLPLFNKLKRATRKYVVDVNRGSNYNKKNTKSGVPLANGFSIYHPGNKVELESDFFYDTFYKKGGDQTAFAKDGKWKKFLEKYAGE